jgi:flagellar biosynthesis/type III secretory pathway ATPase
MADASVAKKVTRWKTLAGALAPRLEEVPHLQEAHRELLADVKSIEDLMVEEELHTSRLRKATKKRKELEGRCLDLAGRLVDGLQSHLGKRNEELLEFGIKPLAAGGGRKKKEGETPAPAPPPVPKTTAS